jgi:hypothetical protein
MDMSDVLTAAMDDYNALLAAGHNPWPGDDEALNAAEARLKRLSEGAHLAALPAPGRRVQVILPYLRGPLGRYGRVEFSYRVKDNGEAYARVLLEADGRNPAVREMIALRCLRDAEGDKGT